jgi:DNA repair exonuclease SbcCD ATPase subunit
MSDIRALRNHIEQLKGKKAQILQTINQLQDGLKDHQKDLRRHEEAREVIREVGLKTQQQLQYHIGDITSLALSAVYNDPYTLVAEFVQRRNKTECDLYFTRDKERVDPLDASGGGVVDVASFALRVASWSMQKPQSDNVLILDEPFKNLSADLLPRAGEMLKQISERLGLQIIMVTHAEQLTETADRVFTVTQRKGISKVKPN